MNLKEEIVRIKSVMGLYEDTIPSSCSEELLKLLNKFSTVDIFRPAIEKMLDPHKESWKGDRGKYEEILKLIGKSSNQIDKILDTKFIYDKDGNWRRINKLNTNYSDIAILVIDILQNEQNNLCDIVEKLKQNDFSDLKNLASSIMSNSEKYYEDYLAPDDEKYTINNQKNTELGDRMEKMTIELLESYGWELIYQSAEGSPIDTKLGIDIIMRAKSGKLAKIQVKGVGNISQVSMTDCEKGGGKFTNKKKSGGYFVNSRRGVKIRPYDINLVVYANDKGEILVVKKYSPISRENGKCVDREVIDFPSSSKGPFYVDHESVVVFKN